MPDDDEGANETSRPENQQEDVLRTLYLVCLEEYGTLLEHAPDDDDVGDDGDAGDGNGNSSSFGDRLETEAVRFEVWDEEAGVTAGRLGGLKHDSLYASLTSGLQRISCLLEVLGRLLNVSSQNGESMRFSGRYCYHTSINRYRVPEPFVRSCRVVSLCLCLCLHWRPWQKKKKKVGQTEAYGVQWPRSVPSRHTPAVTFVPSRQPSATWRFY